MPKKNKSIPRTKKMKQKQRLDSAKQWLATYTGKNIVQGYHKRYGVNLPGAIAELTKLGIAIDPAYIEQVKRSEANKARASKAKAAKKKEEAKARQFADSDETFYYIAGYTAGGAAYGVTWAEMGLLPFEVED